ncbi:MAG: MmgE/PrpD family protein [Lachnospiraceae bacterium]|nr:MmgE/PrpD family protein [Lachnospiraceae bacterium]
MNQSEAFLAEIEKLSVRPLPPEAAARVRRSLLDYLAVACAGAAFQKEKIDRYLAFAQPEEGSSSAIGLNRKLVMKEAVFLNGLNAHALDYDDGTNSGIIHLGSPIFSLLLPLAQRWDVGLEKLLWAAVLGYEASYTLAVSIQPAHKLMGYHSTGTCGVIGAALAATYMLDFTPKERFRVFAAACTAASGTLKVLDDGSELKPYNVAKSALLALTALEMGKAGFEGHPDPLGGGRGFLKMMSGREDLSLKEILLGGTYAVCKSYTKPYASCRYTHPAVEAAIAFHREGIRPREVESVTVRTYSLAIPGHDHREIAGSYSAKMSIPYSVAAALTFGRADLAEFSEEMVRDAAILSLTEKVFVEEEEAFSRAFPARQTALVTLVLQDGQRKEKQVDFPKGEPENPLSEEEFQSRYKALMEYGGVEKEEAERIYRAVHSPELKIRELLP